MQRTRSETFTATALAVSAALVLVAGPTHAQSMEFGKALFVQNCASCHGPEGAGDGPVAKFLEPHPADLTKLSERNDGVFPFGNVWESIASGSLGAHGSSNMPVWGNIFLEEALPKEVHPGVSARNLVESRMLALTYYLQSIQK